VEDYMLEMLIEKGVEKLRKLNHDESVRRQERFLKRANLAADIVKKYLGEYENLFEIVPNYDFTSEHPLTCKLKHRLIVPIILQFDVYDENKVLGNVFYVYIRKPDTQKQSVENVYHVKYDFFDIPCEKLVTYLPLLCAIAFQNRLEEERLLCNLPLQNVEYFNLNLDE
jgi:hypothetical protein